MQASLLWLSLVSLLLFATGLPAAPSASPADHLTAIIDQIQHGQRKEGAAALHSLITAARQNGASLESLASDITDRAIALYIKGELPATTIILEEACPLWSETVGPKDRQTLVCRADLGEMLRMTGRYEEALRQFQFVKDSWPQTDKALRDSLYANVLNGIALLYEQRGDIARATQAYRDALATIPNPDDLASALIMVNLAESLLDQHMTEEAKDLCRRSQKILAQQTQQPQPASAVLQVSLARLNALQGNAVEADKLFTEGLRQLETHFGPNHTQTAIALGKQAAFFMDRGLFAKAEAAQKRNLAIRQRNDADDLGIAAVKQNLGVLYAQQGRLTEAEQLLLESLQMHEKLLGPHHVRLGSVLHNLGWIHDAQAKRDKKLLARAEAEYRRAITIKEANLQDPVTELVPTLQACAGVLEKLKQQGEAKRLRDQADALLARAKTPVAGPAATGYGTALLPREH